MIIGRLKDYWPIERYMAGALSRLYHFVEDGDRACGHHLPYCLGNRKVKIGRLLVGINEDSLSLPTELRKLIL